MDIKKSVTSFFSKQYSQHKTFIKNTFFTLVSEIINHFIVIKKK